MAKLPGAEALGRQTPKAREGVATYSPVEPSRPSERTPVGDLGAPARARIGLGEAEIGLGHSIEIAAQHEQDRQDLLAAEDAFTKLKNKQLDLTYGDGGYATLRGAAAVQQPILKTYTEQFDAATKELASGLRNGQQQTLFAQRAGIASAQYKEGILRHVISEGDTWATEVFDGIVNTGLRGVTVSWSSPVEIASETNRIDEAIKSRAERQHWPAEYTESQRLKIHSQIHDSVISQAQASNNFAYASDWYEAHKGDMDKPMAEKLAVAVQNGREKQAVSNYSSMLRQASNGLPALYELQRRVEGDKTLSVGNREVLLEKIERTVRPVEAKNIVDQVMTPPKIEELTRVVATGVGGANAAADASVTDQDRAIATQNVAEIRRELARPGDAKRKAILEEELRGQLRIAGGTRVGASGPDGSPLAARDTKAMLGEWLARAEQEAERLHPGDPVFRDLAVSQVRSRMSTIVAAQEGMQRQAHGFLLATAAGITDGNAGQPVTNLNDLLANPQTRAAWTTLDGESQRGVIAYVESNARRAEGKPSQINAALVQDLFTRMYLPPDNDRAITRPEQLTQYIAQGLTPEGHTRLVAELQKLKNPEGRDFQQDMNYARTHVLQSMRNTIIGRILNDTDPGSIDYASLRWYTALTDKIDAYRKEGKEPRNLLRADTPDSMVTPAVIQSFLPNARQAVGQRAEQIRNQKAPEVADLLAPPQDESKWGTRQDGTPKGRGFLGALRRPDGGVSTEISVGVQIDGKQMDVPSMVPTLTRAEVETLLKLKENEPVPRPIVEKAAAFAASRIKQGKSVFATASESPAYAPVRLSADSKKADEEFAKLEKGARYIGPDGVVRTK